MTKTLPFIEDQRNKTKEKITITHIAIKALAKVMREVPSVNGRLVLGRYYTSDTAVSVVRVLCVCVCVCVCVCE